MLNSTQPKSHKKLIFMLLLMLATVVGLFCYSVTQKTHAVKEVKVEGLFLTPAKVFSNFQLTDNHGNSFTKENLKGKWTMMFFGFSNCGMVCPTTMTSLSKMYAMLEKELSADKMPQILFVSVDPERDTVEKLNTFVTTFNPHFIGARGSASEIATLSKELHILAIKIQTKNDYYYDHSAEILLINPEGKVQAYLSYPHKPDQLVKDYKTILSSTNL